MSKNFELLQQAGICLNNEPTPAVEATTAGAKTRTPTMPGTLTTMAPSLREESMKLVQKLFLTPGQAPPKAVIFAAVDSKNGCSRLCAVIAQLLAESVSGSVCLLEGNFRTPSLPKLLGVSNHHGLADALRQTGTIRDFAKQVGPKNHWMLSAGSLMQDSLSLLNSDRMKERVLELRKEFDYLVIDAPPLNACADAMVLARLADGLVLVLEANMTRREAALRVTESLRTAKIPVLGAILNNRKFPIPVALYKRL